MSVLTDIVDYISKLKEFTDEKVDSKAKLFFIDCLGCIIAGAHAKPTAIAYNYCADMYTGGGKSTILTTGGPKFNAGAAAFVNGISSHFHDYDDVLPTQNGHPTAVVLPAVLAVAEELALPGERCLWSYRIGVEVIDIISRAVNKKDHVHYSQGWHSTESLGVFGSTAAVGALIGLDSTQMTYALAIAASESSGLQGNFGTMTKAFHAGRGAEKGILAAKIAKLGYNSNPNILEMVGGFALAVSNGIDQDAVTERLALGKSAFLDPGMTMKPYPCCKCNHNMIDATYELLTEHKFTPDQVDEVIIGVQPSFIGCLKYNDPKTMLEGKFSANYNVACVIINGKRPSLSDFEGIYIDNKAIIEMMPKIKMVVDHSIAGGAYANGTWDTKVIIKLTNGNSLEKRVLHSRGEAQNPLSSADVLDKLEDCLSINIVNDKVSYLKDLIYSFDSLKDINDLTKAIESSSKPFIHS
jgi:2-methylcitrate dehydratase PrpD